MFGDDSSGDSVDPKTIFWLWGRANKLKEYQIQRLWDGRSEQN